MSIFKESQDRFNHIEGNLFGGCFREITDGNTQLQFRIRKEDNMPCWIQFWENGKGYQIYEAQSC